MTPKKSILFTVTTDLTYDQRMLRICGALANADFDVTIIGRSLPDSIDLTSKNYQELRLNCFFSKGKFFYIEYNIRLLLSLYFRKKYDAYCAIDLDTILPIYFVSKSKSAKFGYDAHEYFTETPEVARRPFIKKIWNAIADFTIHKSDFRYTVTPSLGALFYEKYQQPFDVVMNVPFMKSNIQESGAAVKYLLYQGALNEGRGLESIIAAMPYIDVELWIAGSGDIEENLIQLVRELQLQSKVHFLGKKTPLELDVITQNAFIGINLLSDISLNYTHSLGNKYFDYIQFGIPQIAMNFLNYKALNQQYEVAILVNDLEVDNILKAINILIEHTEKYNLLRQNCMNARLKWNWDLEKNKLIQLYKNNL